MIRLSRLVFPAILALACQCAAPSAPPPASAARPAHPLLVLGELRAMQGGEPTTVLLRGGHLTERGTLLGTLYEDGRFVDLAGNVRATMRPNGSVDLDGGALTIAEDGTAVLEIPDRGRSTIRLDPSGRVIGASVETRFEALRPELRRTAAFVLLLPDILRWQRPAQIR